jgi:NAD(P)-dependent dehydrogenase (short-subunit alcohol dehydrogenase family)
MTRTVVITGAASGIGKATAALAEAHNWQPIRVDLNEGDVKADLATLQGRATLVKEVTARTGGNLDAVIACAGLALRQILTVKVNYFGAIATLEGLRPLLAKGHTPRAVGVSSFASIMASDTELIEACLSGDEAAAIRVAEEKAPELYYSSSKAAFARWIRQQAITPAWIEAGILLNGIAPGMVATPMTQAMRDDKATRAGIAQAMPMPIGRDARPEEIAELLLWLASPENSMLVGQIIFIDGGAEATIRGNTIW